MSDDEKLGALADELAEYVRKWVHRTWPRIESFVDADLLITLTDPGRDEDGTLLLTARIVESSYAGDIHGRIEGVRDKKP